MTFFATAMSIVLQSGQRRSRYAAPSRWNLKLIHKTSEFRDLMARLRRDEETRAYQRMAGLKVKSQPLDFYRSLTRDPHPSRTTPQTDDDEITYADADRQVALIFNVLVSIVACGVAIWVAARHWNTPQRIAFSMAGSLVVAVAEVGLYMLYLRRLQEAKRKERAKKESKTVLSTWVSEKRPVVSGAQPEKVASGLRTRTHLTQPL
jgi:TMEM199 family protein